MLRFGSGDPASALRDLEGIHRIARHLASEPFLISALNAYAMDSVASETAREIAAGGYIPLDNLIRYQTRLANLSPLPGMREKLAPGERLGFVELVCDIARNNYRSVAEGLPEYEAELKRRAEVEEEEEDVSLPLMGSADSYALLVKLGRIARFASIRRDAVDWDAALRVGAERFEAVDAALAHETFDQRKRALQAVSEELAGLDAEFTGDFGPIADDEDRTRVSRRIGEVLLSTHLDAKTPRAATNAEFRTRMQFDLTRVALALAAYHAQHGAYPADLQALVPDFFAAVPHDLFTGRDLRYERRGEGYLLYSVGWNQRNDNATSDISGTVEGEWGDWRAAEKLGGDDLVVRVPPRVWGWGHEDE